YIAQLWMFWLAPIIGAVLAGAVGRALFEPVDAVQTVVTEERQI
ncbi:MAG: aquaporin, partial [Hyphomicrobiales bacterium]|nr:aquaporin [Hyphomicrobiales bacterium]